MLKTSHRYYLTGLIVATLAVTQSSAKDPLPPGEELASIKEASRDLTREVESLQDTIVELSDKKTEKLYRQADVLLGDLVRFDKSLESNGDRAKWEKAFDELDGKVHELLKSVETMKPEQPLLKRLANRVGAADDYLHFALSGKNPSSTKVKEVLERQARALLSAAHRLDRIAAFTVGTIQGRGVLVKELHQLADAAQHFEKISATGLGAEELRKEFVAINTAWENAIQSLQKVKAADHMRLIRAAGEFDVLHERLFGLLHFEGKRPQLVVIT